MIKKTMSQADLIVKVLSDLYPKCFILTEEVKPVKIGILDQVWSEISPKNLNLFTIFPAEFKASVDRTRAKNVAIAKAQAKKDNRELTVFETSLTKDLTDEEYLVLGAISKTKLRQAMGKYTSSLNYLKSFKLGAKRIDLDGSDTSEEINAEEVDFAEKRVASFLVFLEKIQAEKKERQLKYLENKKKAARFAANKAKNNTENKEYNKKSERKFNPKKTTTKNTIAASQKVKAKDEQNRENKSYSLNALAIDDIFVGDEVKIKLAQKINQAKVIEIQKDGAKVQLTSGMVITLGIEHIFK